MNHYPPYVCLFCREAMKSEQALLHVYQEHVPKVATEKKNPAVQDRTTGHGDAARGPGQCQDSTPTKGMHDV